MSATATLQYPVYGTDSPLPVVRMDYPDVERLSDWIATKLQKRTSLATPQAVKTWLRSCLYANDTWFARSAHAVAMARVVLEPLKAARAEEVFVFCEEGAEKEAADLYVPMSKWAVNLDCYRLDVDIFSDVPRGEITKRLGQMRARQGYMVHF